MIKPASLFDFQGQWRLSRVIQDAKAAQTLHAEGTAEWAPDEEGLCYREAVTLHIPGQPAIRGTRKYLWRTDQGQIAVHFEDGRYFHRLALGQKRINDHHDCPPDKYHASYDFSQWPQWSVRWVVSGPDKSYEMHTRYSFLHALTRFPHPKNSSFGQ